MNKSFVHNFSELKLYSCLFWWATAVHVSWLRMVDVFYTFGYAEHLWFFFNYIRKSTRTNW